MILASTSTLFGGTYLDYIKDEIKLLFKHTKEILFIPYARPSGLSHDKYTDLAFKYFKAIGIHVKGAHECINIKDAVKKSKGIFVGGGNSFLLLKQLIDKDLISILKKEINNGKPYLGTSAGINICGPSICTSNDMPIIFPKSFTALNIIPFNINPHYLDPIEGNEHMGETRETRIKEFHHFNSQNVIGLKEGSYLLINGNSIILMGDKNAKVFKKNKKMYEIKTGFNLKNL